MNSMIKVAALAASGVAVMGVFWLTEPAPGASQLPLFSPSDQTEAKVVDPKQATIDYLRQQADQLRKTAQYNREQMKKGG